MVCLLAALAGVPPAAAGEVLLADPATRFVHQRWTVEDGLPVNNLTDVVQTPDGWLWIGSFDGLLRFDGLRFTRFDTATVPELASNRIVGLEVRGDTLWIFPERGHPSRRAGGRFHAVALPEGVAADAPRMAVGDDGVLWLADDHRLFRVEGGRTVPGPRGLEGRRVHHIFAGAAGRIWLQFEDPGPFAVIEDGEVRWLDVGLPSSEYVEYVSEGGDGSLWIGTVSRLWRVLPEGSRRASRGGDPEEVAGTETPAGAADARLRLRVAEAARGAPVRWGRAPVPRFLQQGPGGAIWESAGTSLWRDGRPVLDLPDVGTGIRALAFDHEGTAWLATDNAGLQALKPARVTTLSEAEGLAEGNSYAVHQDRHGTIWIGGATGGLTRVRSAAAGGGLAVRVETVPVVPAPGLADRTTPFAIYDDPGSELLIGAPGCLYRLASGRRLPLDDVTAVIPGEELIAGVVRALHRARDGRLLLGHRYGLLASRPGDPGADGWRFTQVAGTAGMRVRALLETPDGDLWLGTNGAGAVRVTPGGVVSVTTAGGLSSDLVRALHLDSSGHLWIATEDAGLNRVAPDRVAPDRVAPDRVAPDRVATDRLEPAVGSSREQAGFRVAVIQKRDGLWDDALHEILEDDAGWLWLSSNRGVFRVLRAQLEDFVAGRVARVDSVVYDEGDGMRHREANGGADDAGLRARDGRLWFPTQDGVAIFDPESLADPGPPPPVDVERLLAGEVEIGLAAGAATLEPEQRSFEIAYTALSFRAPERIRFRYRLSGYDEGWVEAGGRRRAFYTKVPPGRYSFEVQARSAAGAWNRDGASLALTVRPFFYQTGWFRGAVALALAAAVAGGLYQRERRQRALRRRLEQQVAGRTAELARERDVVADQAARLAELDRIKSDLFANVSHEFRTPLTLVLGPLSDLEAGRHGELSPEAARQVGLARRNSERVLAIVDEFLDVARLDAGGLALRVRRIDLGALLAALVERFAALAEGRGVNLRLALPAGQLPLWCDPDQLEKVFANLLSNALHHTPRGGAVETAVAEPDAGTLAVEVRDDGPGIAEEDRERIFDRFYRVAKVDSWSRAGTGLGLSLARQLAELHGGRLTVDSTLGEGSVFRVELRCGAAHFTAAQIVAGSEAAAAAGGGREGPGPPPAAGDLSPAEVGDAGGEGGGASAEDRTTVLVVDDHPELRAYVRRHLEERYRVIEAADGAAGLERAREELPDVVVSDVMMPEMDGFELCRALRADPELDWLPLILLTARAAAEDKLAGLRRGADAYLTKPFDVAELRARIDNLIALRRRLRERFAAATLPPPALPLAPGVRPSGDDREFLTRVRSQLSDGLEEEGFNVEALAGRLHLDRTHLFRRLRELTGSAPSALILEARMKRAAELLERDDGDVGEVAVAVGFKSAAHFSERFRDRYGLTPTAYRARRAAAVN